MLLILQLCEVETRLIVYLFIQNKHHCVEHASPNVENNLTYLGFRTSGFNRLQECTFEVLFANAFSFEDDPKNKNLLAEVWRIEWLKKNFSTRFAFV